MRYEAVKGGVCNETAKQTIRAMRARGAAEAAAEAEPAKGFAIDEDEFGKLLDSECGKR